MFPSAKKQRLDLSKITLRQCTKVLEVLQKMAEAGPFLAPVDPVLLNIPDYPKIVKNPMDFGTIGKKLGEGAYQDTDTFASDVRLVFNNSYIYNKKDSHVGKATKVLDDAFEAKLGELVASSGATPSVARVPSLAPISLVSTGPALISSIRAIVKSLLSHALSGPFREPLDWRKAGLTTYPDVIKTPMDLGTIMRKLEESAYTNVAGVKCDLELVWQNCITCNGTPAPEPYPLPLPLPLPGVGELHHLQRARVLGGEARGDAARVHRQEALAGEALRRP